MRIVLNTICLEPNRWTPHKTPHVPLLDLLKPIAQAGFTYIDIWSPHVENLAPDALRQVAQRCKDLNLTVTRLSTYLTGDCLKPTAPPIEQAAARLCQIARDFGANSMRIFFGNKDFKDFTEDLWQTSLHHVQTLREEAQKAGITIAAETHPGSACNCLEGCQEVLRRTQEKMSLIYQFMSNDASTNAEHVRTLSPHIHAIHLQDRDENNAFTRLGQGVIGYDQILATAQACGIDCDLVIEFVEGCKVPNPNAFDLHAVLQTAIADRQYVEARLS